MKRTIIVGIELTTDEPDETLTDPALWAKAVGIFKADVDIHAVVIGGTEQGEAVSKPAKKKATGLKKRAASKKTTKKKPKKT